MPFMVDRKIVNIARVQHPYRLGSQAFCRPQPLAAGIVDEYPPLVGIGDKVRVAAVGREPVRIDQAADDLNRLARGGGALHRRPGQVAVLRAALRGLLGRGFRHFHQFGTRRRPDVPRRHAMLVQSAIGQRGREAGELRVVRGDVLVGGIGLGDLDQLARDARLIGHTDPPGCPLRMRLARHDLDPVARGFMAEAGQQGGAVLGQGVTHVDAEALFIGVPRRPFARGHLGWRCRRCRAGNGP
ncbi:hypothetical protein MKP05_15585 [Halomonas sp. EGI 63088]|uniref:Uncharacterized protein n=1 Tax=Halomonas flagellata TaxID=2920385 RepID=A0ABS9RXI5_9GAMM|nr:hypothetical protein [Halomonas flagellata]MCH4564526.1 hypothetical protein [Halomonas flagellata]